MSRTVFGLLAVTFVWVLQNASVAGDYAETIRADAPIAWWRMEPSKQDPVLRNEIGDSHHGLLHGKLEWGVAGPRPSEYPDFDPLNQAIRIPAGPNYIRVPDSGDNSELDFGKGDGLTIEAWVLMDDTLKGGYPYILGKGRTHNPGTKHNNQNYSLRLAPDSNGVCLSFFFCDSETKASPGAGIGEEGHRWTTTTGIPDDGAWHHVAVTYVFGQADSMHGYIDGQEVSGKWDMGGATDKAPVMDNDELWIGSAMGGGATLGAMLDEVALYKKALTKEQIQKHVTIHLSEAKFVLGKIDPETVPEDLVRVEIMERVSVARSWKFRLQPMEPLYETDLFALKELPTKYTDKGLITNRPVGFLIHACSKIELPAGEYEFCLRSLDAARLYVDGNLVTETAFMSLRSDAHQEYYHLPDYGPEMLSIAGGHQESRVKIKLDAGAHVFSLYRRVGNKGHGSYFGELAVGYSRDGSPFKFLSPTRDIPFTDAGWLTFLDEDRSRLEQWNQNQRLQISAAEREYWNQRHQWSRQQVRDEIPIPEIVSGASPVDQFILAGLKDKGVKPQPVVDDWKFLRRVCLDTIGTIPTPELIDQFYKYPREIRREKIVDDLLASSGWAHHWVGYWQDVLGENPGLTKPQLNNSGPFRWFLYESFLDNKPMDRFVTELVMMEGNPHIGGPAGFGIASQNDVPMAAKAHILGTAFLAVEMKCARCHDAPYHDVQQKDLFSLAAMLKRTEEKVPGTSSIPASPEQLARMAVKVTLPPGSSVKPDWPFAEFVSFNPSEQTRGVLPQELMRSETDSREQLAAMLTSPHNNRFARVLVNRVWKRYLGRGLVEPVDDWEEATFSYPELHDYLARELVRSGYDLKHIARLILNSDAYQREPVPGIGVDSAEAQLFAGPVRRKLTGEQIADSLYLAAGKSFASEELNIDGDGRQDETIFGHLGIPTHGWQLVSVSNERDRPSMTLPVAQGIVDLMSAFGWRQQRQDPLTVREDPLTALQPMALANGTGAARAIDFTEDSALTALAIEAPDAETFVDELFERLLTRPAESDERLILIELLRDGFEERVVAGPEAIPPKRMFRTGITWSNHFAPEADVEAVERQRAVIAGEAATVRLNTDWRERAEDVVWTLVNSPEFVFVP